MLKTETRNNTLIDKIETLQVVFNNIQEINGVFKPFKIYYKKTQQLVPQNMITLEFVLQILNIYILNFDAFQLRNISIKLWRNTKDKFLS